ncbi:hypothetical protein [Serratia liquefaciens]|uniref:hypothetical protein n=1 Tax=Serratia liquefaciens TaxID=614 RepID=UPI0037F9EF6D
MKLDERQLSHQWLFWLSILIPLLISLLLSIPLWLQTKINISAEGYDDFLRIFKLPIGVLSLSIPLVAIVAHIHRTIQTAKQIELTNQKNITDRFFAHHKYIVDSLSSIKGHELKINEATITPKVSHPYALYRFIFPTSSYTSGIDISTQNTYIDSIIDRLAKIEELLEEAVEFTSKNNNKNYPDPSLAVNFGKLWVAINELNRKLEFSTQAINFSRRFKFLSKSSTLEVKLVIPYANEDELKNIIGATIYLLSRIFEVVGVEEQISMEDHELFLQYSMKGDFYLYESIFDSLVKCNEEMIFSRGTGVFSEEEHDTYAYLPKL